jgi:hypothetical protein
MNEMVPPQRPSVVIKNVDFWGSYPTQQTSMPTMSMAASGGKADIPDPLSNVR